MANKALRITLGVILLIIGGGMAIAGAVVAAVSGPDNTMRTGYHAVTTSSRALVARAANITPGPVPDGVGTSTAPPDPTTE
jgi:hypothetical protein